MVDTFWPEAIAALDLLVAVCLPPLCLWILVSGLDDLFILMTFLVRLLRPGLPPPSPDELEGLPEKRIAVFVPLWHEHQVIGQMLEHNIAALRYSAYDFFVGAYPNDEPTQEAVRQVESRFPNVHLCLCPHDGPTSKADCLNWIYQRMQLHEEHTGLRYDLIVTHDAEDIIHPESFRWMNWYADHFDMVQTPVLPLPTPLRLWTHGLYCDDFAEYHTKDLPVRNWLGGFVPSSGVGTAYRREALERLAQAESNRIFEPGCLTEDYENGLRLQRLGCRQVFVPIHRHNGLPMATREYFPQSRSAALRQRTRWVTGIALQGWQRNGWSGGLRRIYWFWRDRKGLAGNPASLLANLIFLYGVLTWIASRLSGRPWGLGEIATLPVLQPVLAATLALGCIHVLARAVCAARIYGWRFALGVPVRVVYGNWLNAHASINAIIRFLGARLRRHPLVWVKTEHAYPSRAALMPHKRLLGEILSGSGYITPENLEAALASRPTARRLGEHLVALGMLTEAELYEALSLQQALPVEDVAPEGILAHLARALPAHVIRRWRVLPVRVAAGHLHLASPELPTDELQLELRKFTHLEIRFHLVTPSNFRELQQRLL